MQKLGEINKNLSLIYPEITEVNSHILIRTGEGVLINIDVRKTQVILNELK